MCAAIAYGVATVAYCQTPASAAEETVKAALLDTKSLVVPKRPLIADQTVPQSGSEPLGLTETIAEELAAEAFYNQNQELFDQIFILERRKDTLSDALISLQKGNKIYLPAHQIARIVKFPSTINPETYSLNGSFFNILNTYNISPQTNSYTVGGKTFPLNPQSVIINDAGQGRTELYVDIETLNKIWPLELTPNLSNLSINIASKKKLPYELEIERKKNQATFNSENEQALDLTHLRNPYWILGPHTFNLSNILQWDRSENLLSNNFGLSGRGDLLGTTANYNINTGYNKDRGLNLQNARLLLSRENYGDGTLPAGLNLLQLGDITTNPSSQITRSLTGRGVLISSKLKKNQQKFDEITINGYGEAGWDVEIYRGKQLLNFGSIDESGEYRFDNVPLSYGKNTFRIVLYGPQGQTIERFEDYRIKNSMLAAGETNYEAATLDYRTPLFEVNDSASNDRGTGSADFIRVNRGISYNLTSFATATKVPTNNNGDRRYVTAGAIFQSPLGLGQIEAYKELQGGNALEARFISTFAGFNSNSRATIFNDFESPEAGFGKRRKTLEAQTFLSKNFKFKDINTNIGAGVSHTEYADTSETTQLTTQQNLYLKNASINNNLRTVIDDRNQDRTDGSISYNKRLNSHYNFRTTLDYDVFPNFKADIARLQLSYSDLDKFRAGFNINQDLNNPNNANASLSASYDFDTFYGGAEINWINTEGVDFLLRANTTFGPTGEDKIYTPSSQYRGYKTALAAQIYHDIDGDGQFGPGDEPATGSRIRINNRKSPPADAKGFIDMPNAGAPGMANITLDRKSLSNTFLVPKKDGYSTILRTGTKPFVNFPLYMTGTIDGTIRYADGAPIPGTIVQLRDTQGTLIQEVPTLYDGFYVFEFVRPGTYTVQVSPSHKFNIPPKTVLVSSEDLFAYGVDLYLLEQASEGSATDLSVRDDGRVAHTYHAQVAEGMLKPAPFSSDGQFDTVVRAVRIGEYPYKVRLVLDLSAPSGYKITSENDGHIINIDLPSTAWDATREWKNDKHPMFKNCEVFSIDNATGTRIRLSAKKPVKVFYNANINAENGLPDRIYIDFIPAK